MTWRLKTSQGNGTGALVSPDGLSCYGTEAGDALLDISAVVFAFVDRMLTDPEQ